MSRDLADRLRELPPELPDVPDRVRHVRRLARRRRRAQALAVAAGTAIAVAIPAVMATTLWGGGPARPPLSAPAALPAAVAACDAPGLKITPLPRSAHLIHTRVEAEPALHASASGAVTNSQIFPALVSSSVADKVALGLSRVPRPTWVGYAIRTEPSPQPHRGGAVLNAPLAGTRLADLRLLDDQMLAPIAVVACRPVSATAGGVGYGIPDHTKVAVTGVVAPAGAGYVVCLAEAASTLTFGGPFCVDQVALVGDAKELARWARQGRDVRGVWNHNTLVVTSLAAASRVDDGPMFTTPPCAKPNGGWASVPASKTPGLDHSALDRYRSSHPGVLTAIAFFSPSHLTPVLTVASTDPTATRAALQTAYPRALCVVDSLFTAAQVHAANVNVQEAFKAHRLPGVYGFGPGISQQAQPLEELEALTDRPEIHQALSKVPEQMLVIHPWIRQLR